MHEMRGIKGLEGREPIGAVVCIGRKGEKGNPVETDRFFFVEVNADSNDVRQQHPAFGPFNVAPVQHRKILYGNLVHATAKECFEWHLKAQVLSGKKAHPDKRPACIGDGQRALRWFPEGGPKDFREIPCPNDACEYRQGTPCCKPWMRFLFRPLWTAERQGLFGAKSPLPSPLTKLTSASWHNVMAFVGLFKYVGEQAKQLGVPSYTVFGLPIMISLGRKTKPSEKRAFPVLQVTVDGDLQEFLWGQRLRRIEGSRTVVALPDGDQQDPAEVHLDLATITPGLPRPAGDDR